MLAEAELLRNCEATSHCGYAELFRLRDDPMRSMKSLTAASATPSSFCFASSACPLRARRTASLQN